MPYRDLVALEVYVLEGLEAGKGHRVHVLDVVEGQVDYLEYPSQDP